MLKTNSKKAINNIWDYLEEFIDAINDERITYQADKNYLQPGNRHELAKTIYEIYESEKKNNDNMFAAGRITDAALFEEWASGLALCGMFDFWYHCTAVKILGDILEETETEREKFTESDAEKMLTSLIYREVIKNK